jgi:hypothetical protein
MEAYSLELMLPDRLVCSDGLTVASTDCLLEIEIHDLQTKAKLPTSNLTRGTKDARDDRGGSR